MLIYEHFVNKNKKLIDAINKNDFNTIKKIVNKNFNLNEKYFGYTILITAIINENIDIKIIKYLIKLGADINITDDNNRSPLNWAIYVGNIEIVKLLIKLGADINNIDFYGDSLLIIAAIQQKYDILFLLLSLDINWFIKNKQGYFFLDYLKYDEIQLIKKLYPENYKKYLKLQKSEKFNL